MGDLPAEYLGDGGDDARIGEAGPVPVQSLEALQADAAAEFREPVDGFVHQPGIVATEAGGGEQQGLGVDDPVIDGTRILLVLDNASWHKTKRLNWRHIEPIYLPPYSPDFNPIERFWQHLKSHHLAGFITKDGELFEEKIFQAIRSLLQTPETIRSVCRTHSE